MGMFLPPDRACVMGAETGKKCVGPCLTFPERTASSNASGMEPADVLPYSARFVITCIALQIAA